jgi:hypothetical protein
MCAGGAEAGGVGQEQIRSDSKEQDAQGHGEAASPRYILLDRHDHSQAEHPTGLANADCKHQQHQRPATADAKDAVMDSHPECAEDWLPAVPLRNDKAER